MDIGSLIPAGLQANQLDPKSVSAGYNKLSENLRKFTPLAIQCAIFCGGSRCKYENSNWPPVHMAIKDIFSHWWDSNLEYKIFKKIQIKFPDQEAEDFRLPIYFKIEKLYHTIIPIWKFIWIFHNLEFIHGTILFSIIKRYKIIYSWAETRACKLIRSWFIETKLFTILTKIMNLHITII